MKYSIVVPAYNAEKYVGRCLDSLINQTYDNIEIIVIDDGSTDKTLDVLNKYEKKYRKVKIYHQKNSGVIAAREYGLKQASGVYCFIVDADDWLDLDTVEKIDKTIKRNGDIDVLKFNYKYEPSGKIGEGYKYNNKILNERELYFLHRDLLLTDKYNNLSNQVFKKVLYDAVKLTKDERIKYGEDLMVNLDIIGRAKHVILINDAFYHYYENFTSKTHNATVDDIYYNISDNIKLGRKRIKYLKVFEINNIKVDEIKSLSLLFACDSIKKYVLSKNPLDINKMKRCIDKSGLYDYLEGSQLTRFGGVDYIVCRCIIKRKYTLLKWIRPFAKIRDSIRKKRENFVIKKQQSIKWRRVRGI